MGELWKTGAKVQAQHPGFHDEAHHTFGGQAYMLLRDFALRGNDALVVPSEWRQFRSSNFAAQCMALTDLVVRGSTLFPVGAMHEIAM